ncbi:MAG: amidohydrolase, partial [Treponema sp.]|nr:amidohydrolase [Treponema sp.]
MNNEELQKKLVPWFEWFHRHPELGHEEIETTAKIREILEGIGVEIMDTGLKTGLVARIGSGRPVTALRCDIDALPITEESGLPYTSGTPGRMHACGHDFHTAAMLGAAVLLHEGEGRLQGSVKLIFQPGEETARGSAIVLSTGALDDMEEIYGLHVSPELPPGRIGVSPGPVYAAVGDFSMRIQG